jgi:hypothetical protein
LIFAVSNISNTSYPVLRHARAESHRIVRPPIVVSARVLRFPSKHFVELGEVVTRAAGWISVSNLGHAFEREVGVAFAVGPCVGSFDRFSLRPMSLRIASPL